MQTHRAILKGDRLKWTDSEPTDLDPEQLVQVTILEPDDTDASTQGLRMAKALAQLAASNAFSGISDPSEWQREIRKDRPPSRPRGMMLFNTTI
jgi:hypothetical protein